MPLCIRTTFRSSSFSSSSSLLLVKGREDEEENEEERRLRRAVPVSLKPRWNLQRLRWSRLLVCLRSSAIARICRQLFCGAEVDCRPSVAGEEGLRENPDNRLVEQTDRERRFQPK